MPVLKFTNDEIGTLLHALRTEAGEWLRYKTFHGSAQNINSVSTILKNTQTLEARIQEVYDSMTDEDDKEPIEIQITEAEAKRRTAVANIIISEIDAVERAASGNAPTEDTPAPRAGSGWHHEHGWLPSVLNKLAELREFESAGPYGGLGIADLSPADVEGDQDQMSPGTWTTIPGDFEITFAGPKPFPYWHDMKSQSDGLIERPDGYRLAVCRIRHTREGFKLGFTGAFRDMFRGHFRRYYPDLDSAKTAAEEIFRGGLERHGLALAS